MFPIYDNPLLVRPSHPSIDSCVRLGRWWDTDHNPVSVMWGQSLRLRVERRGRRDEDEDEEEGR